MLALKGGYFSSDSPHQYSESAWRSQLGSIDILRQRTATEPGLMGLSYGTGTSKAALSVATIASLRSI